MMGRGQRKLQELTRMVQARTVSEDEVRHFDPELRSFVNVNTPEDYARALRVVQP